MKILSIWLEYIIRIHLFSMSIKWSNFVYVDDGMIFVKIFRTTKNPSDWCKHNFVTLSMNSTWTSMLNFCKYLVIDIQWNEIDHLDTVLSSHEIEIILIIFCHCVTYLSITCWNRYKFPKLLFEDKQYRWYVLHKIFA